MTEVSRIGGVNLTFEDSESVEVLIGALCVAMTFSDEDLELNARQSEVLKQIGRQFASDRVAKEQSRTLSQYWSLTDRPKLTLVNTEGHTLLSSYLRLANIDITEGGKWCLDGYEHAFVGGGCTNEGCDAMCCDPETINGQDVHGQNCRGGR